MTKDPRRTTTTPIRRDNAGFAAIFTVVVAVAFSVFYITQMNDKNNKDAICGTNGDIVSCIDRSPAVATPEPTPASLSEQLSGGHIELALTTDSGLNGMQRHYIEKALIVAYCPLCIGVDRPALSLSMNERVLWAALFCSEVSCNPWDDNGDSKVSSVGCTGAAQICNMSICGGVEDEDRLHPERSLYLGACYFDELIDQYDGDYNMAIAAYKGALVDGVITHPEQVDTVWDFVRVRGVSASK